MDNWNVPTLWTAGYNPPAHRSVRAGRGLCAQAEGYACNTPLDLVEDALHVTRPQATGRMNLEIVTHGGVT